MKKNKSNIILATAMLGVVSVVATYHASAITYQDSTNVEFTFNPTINVSLSSSDLTISNLAPGSTSDSNVITATVSTNAGYGYYLSATAGTAGGDTNLTNTADNTYNFASLSSNATTLSAIPDNKWGYSYSTDNGTTWISGDNGSALAGYNGLPLDADDSGATGVKLLSSDSFAGTGSVQFKIGARASSDQAAGTYTGTVNFYAIGMTGPTSFDDAYLLAGKTKHDGYYTMQDASSSICSAVAIGQTGQLMDIRDNQVYNVAKLKDGKCWMTQNLNIPGDILLSSDTTDFPSTYSLPTDQGWQSDGKLPVSSPDGFDQNNYAYIYRSDDFDTTASPRISDYSWDAITLGSGRTISEDGVDAPYSICPKNWHLPSTRSDVDSSSDYRSLAIAYGGSESNSIYSGPAGPIGEPISMYYELYSNANLYVVSDDPSRFSSGNTSYWSSTSVSSTNGSYALNFNLWINHFLPYVTVDVASTDVRSAGASVRCLFN